MKLESKERLAGGKIRRVYQQAKSPLERVLESPEVDALTKARLRAEKARLNPFSLKREVDQHLREIAAMRRPKESSLAA